MVVTFYFRATPPADILIRNGRLLDGSGTPEKILDIVITGDRITFIGNAKKSKLKAKRIIDAKGMIVSPGFIDPHTHADEDLSNANRKGNVNYLMQGVTTVVINNDGASVLPLSKRFAFSNPKASAQMRFYWSVKALCDKQFWE